MPGSVLPDRPSRRRARVCAGMATATLVVVVLAVTLVPGSAVEGGACLACGNFALADAILNLVLFVPLGIGLAMLLPRYVWLPVALAVGLSTGIELAQLLLPGRYATLADVVANGTGAAIGAGLVRHAGRPRAPAESREAVAWGRALFPVLASIVSLTLLAPSFPRTSWYGEWTPDLGRLGRYEGTVLEASIGNDAFLPGRLPDAVVARRRLAAGDVLETTVVGVPATGRLAPVLAIHDEAGREILFLGVDASDLVGRLRRLAAGLRLKSPEARLPGGAPGPGETTRLGMRLDGKDICLSRPGVERCDRIASPSRGWVLLMGMREDLFFRARRVFDVLWTALLFFPLGLGLRREASAGILPAVAALGAVLVVTLFSDAGAAPWTLAGAGAGLMAGRVAGRFLPRPLAPLNGN